MRAKSEPAALSGNQVCRLFVYGTLSPGRSHHHLLQHVQGTWQKASIQGKLYPRGVGPIVGYPVVDMSTPEGPVAGFLLTSNQLWQYWRTLDDYEGEGYRRAKVKVDLIKGEQVEAFAYVLNNDPT